MMRQLSNDSSPTFRILHHGRILCDAVPRQNPDAPETVMSDLTPKHRFLQSLNRCSASEEFIPDFYRRFLSTSDDVRDKFRDTDFEQQNRMLLRSLKLAAGATSGDPDSLREIRDRAETHDRHHLDIEPRLYDLWLTSVIDAAREFDSEWEEATEDAWKMILGHVIRHMIRYY